MSLPFEPTIYARWITVLVSIGLAIDAIEILYSRREYGSRGILSWSILKLDSRFALAGRGASLMKYFLGAPGYLVLISLQLLLALTLNFGARGVPLAACVSVILVIKLLSHLRHAHGGLDGSDQMQIVILAALTGFYWTNDRMVMSIALLFIAGQAILSYVVAGIAKAASSNWRSGRAIVGIMATDYYGNRIVGPWLHNNRWAAVGLCWSVIVFECLAPALIFVGPIPCIAFIACGLTFHLVIALMMGLNTFVWSFSATYPALLFVNTLL